jgi:hypothetical protein
MVSKESKEVQDVLEHFGISNREVPKGFWTTKNTGNMRKILGIETVLKSEPKEIRKARIIIDYEADFPHIVTRVIKR